MTLLWSSLLVIQLVFLVAWLWQVKQRDATHVDVLWAASVGAAGLTFLLLGSGHFAVRLLAGSLLLLWSARLVWHIRGRIEGAGEDGRYAAMRQKYGARINVVHLFFFAVQGLLAWLFALPFLVIAEQSAAPGIFTLLGFLTGVGAVLGETLADYQLATFRRDPNTRGRTCRKGLWRYSRHPNYFFEWLHWCSYPLMALGAPLGGWVWLAPLAMFLFLWFVTGIPHTERQAVASRGDDYRRYQQETSMFFPWRPKT